MRRGDPSKHRLLDRFGEVVDRWPAPAARGLAVVSIALLGFVDYLSGPQIAFSVFYLLPLSVIGWTSERRRLLTLGACLLSAMVWLVADITAGAEYGAAWIPVWNTTTRFIVFAMVVTLVANLRESVAREKDVARTDHLTGVANTRSFMEALTAEVQRVQRHRAPMSLAYVDVDDFKRINDSVGHAGGDEVLKKVAGALSSSLRQVDLVGRLGGDEFAILLPATDGAGAGVVVASLRDRVANTLDDLTIGVTLSIGCMTFLNPPAGVGEVLHAADELMYESKRGGKDSVTLKVLDQGRPGASVS